MRRNIVSFFAIALALASTAFAQTPAPLPPPSDAAKALVGVWELSNPDRDKRCQFTFKLDAAPGGLDVPAAARVEQVRNRSASWARNSAVGGWTLRRVVKPAVVWAGSRR